MIFEVITAGGDNYCYLLAPGPGKKGLLVDPVNVEGSLDAVERHDLSGVMGIVNTHSHPDHTSGNGGVSDKTGATIIAHQADNAGIGASKTVGDGDVIDVDGLAVKVMHTPGHTPGGICLFVEPDDGPPRVITGDTLFLSGCGNPSFGGNPEQLFESLSQKLMTLPDDTQMHPGHDYSIKNLEFALDREPENQAAADKLSQAREASKKNEIIQSTIGDEKMYNPFFRLDSDGVYSRLTEKFPDLPKEDKAIFLKLRELRNSW